MRKFKGKCDVCGCALPCVNIKLCLFCLIKEIKEEMPKENIPKKQMTLNSYITAYAKFKLNINYYSLSDLVSEIYCTILINEKLAKQLKPYILSNSIPPKGKDLSLLKAVIVRTRLRFINKENTHLSGRRYADIPNLIENIVKSDQFYTENDQFLYKNTHFLNSFRQKKQENKKFLKKNLK